MFLFLNYYRDILFQNRSTLLIERISGESLFEKMLLTFNLRFHKNSFNNIRFYKNKNCLDLLNKYFVNLKFLILRI